MADLGTAHDVLSASALRSWVQHATELLTLARPVIDQANVFPVADADTGTNLCLTLGQGRASVDALATGAGIDEVLDALAEGALLGARGNSGVILSEYLRGFAAGARGARSLSAAAVVVAALSDAARCAHAAVGDPCQGTILSAAAGASEAAQAALADGADLARVVQLARDGAFDALRRSADDLDVLRAAGVLDAGAYGLVLILDALARALCGDVSAVHGTIVPMTVLTTLSVDPTATRDGLVSATCAHEPGAHDRLDGEFEVMYVVEHSTLDPDDGECGIARVAGQLREQLQEVGSSVAVVGGATRPVTGGPGSGARGDDERSHGLWQVHVHTDRPLEALRVGRPWTCRQIVVRSLEQQVFRAADEREACAVPARTGLVACTTSPALVTELARAGAVVVLRAASPVAASDVLRAAEETGAQEVFLLPADAATGEAAADWVSHDGGAPHDAHVQVLASTSDLHVVAAVACWAALAPGSDPGEVVDALRATLASVRVVTVPDGAGGAVADALDRLLGSGHEPATVLTVLVDDLVPEEVVLDIERAAARLSPGTEVVTLASGRPSGAVVLGAE